MTGLGPLRDDADSVDRSFLESFRDWVRNGLTGSTATPGHLIRSMIAFLPAYVVVALLLSPPVLRVAVLVLAVLLALVDSFAFIALSRRLAQRCGAEDRENARLSGNRRHRSEGHGRPRHRPRRLPHHPLPRSGRHMRAGGIPRGRYALPYLGIAVLPAGRRAPPSGPRRAWEACEGA
jgi:hypothetical protein